MIIIGIDPGYAIVGIGVVEYVGNKFRTLEYNAITTPAGMATTERLKKIYQEMNMYLDKYNPDAVAIEELFFNSNQKTAINVAQARGVLLVAVSNRNIPICEYTPLQVKQSVTGYGRADKKQIQTMVKMLLGLNAIPKPDDAADALAIAICHAHSNKMNNMFGINNVK
ncbi:MAG: crossover junction endodeoxyribonuclease RuvC [Clostridia bacterium]|nr:crossover junction endodeoxyribonuclease RuvC [Clostridia bacterium]MCI8979914.1 crossover junction endodeoxyribonuclease RuvC [Clostridia bacterium]MCI9086015.1 crossover junction endodeoxyribonuclease RuvC [Clostridia bacterium]NDO19404.1 crossover junction endodeoxyribonuclease RuvC [Lachnospiraceae bacterium MD329]